MSSAIRIVAPSASSSANTSPSHQPRQPPGSGSTTQDKKLCRNILIYGQCRFEDKGCTYSHQLPDPAKPPTPQPLSAKTAASAQVFVPGGATATATATAGTTTPGGGAMGAGAQEFVPRRAETSVFLSPYTLQQSTSNPLSRRVSQPRPLRRRPLLHSLLSTSTSTSTSTTTTRSQWSSLPEQVTRSGRSTAAGEQRSFPCRIRRPAATAAAGVGRVLRANGSRAFTLSLLCSRAERERRKLISRNARDQTERRVRSSTCPTCRHARRRSDIRLLPRCERRSGSLLWCARGYGPFR